MSPARPKAKAKAKAKTTPEAGQEHLWKWSTIRRYGHMVLLAAALTAAQIGVWQWLMAE